MSRVESSPIRVRAFYTPYPHWGAHAGGHQVCRFLDPSAVDVSLLPVSNSDGDWPIPANPLNDALRNRLCRHLLWYKLSDLTAELRAVPVSFTNRVDIIHYLDAEHTARLLPRWIKKWPHSRVRTVATYHQPPELLDGLRVRKEAVGNLDLVLVVSPTQEDYFRQFLPADRVRTLLHGVDAEFFRPPAAHRSDGTLRCITAGHWMRDWNAIGSVARALSEHRGIEFHVVTGQSTGLEGLANVKIHLDVDDNAFLALYQEADFLFLPLVNSTANNSLLEGLACGLPVVSTPLRSVQAYVGEGPAILVERNDPDGFVEAIRSLCADPDRRARMGKAARARAEELAWPRVASRWERAYRELVGSAA
jgi:glycosyltransferase involved in cell wall biosynthesis